jgi:hypothetical protein
MFRNIETGGMLFLVKKVWTRFHAGNPERL